MSNKYIVLSLLSAVPEDMFGCHIIPEGQLYPMIYRIAYGPDIYWNCAEWVALHCKPIQKWWLDEKADAEKRMDTARSRKDFAELLLSENRKVELAHIDGVPEFKVEWEGGFIKYPVLYTRTSKITAYAEFSAPDLNSIWGDVTNCATGGAVAATLAAIFASPAAALPAFKAAFLACIVPRVGERAKEISVALSTHQESGDWHRV
ncbi:hypothetical protein [Mesorhizobium sp. M1169]|uniref:hypothetical protein n=1 Tax=unclassified Mesorhizobium TaxID=325217 RepID=UPI0033383EFC